MKLSYLRRSDRECGREKLGWALAVILFGMIGTALAAPQWSAKLDGRVRFYQTTELGVLIVGTEKVALRSLMASQETFYGDAGMSILMKRTSRRFRGQTFCC